MSKSGRDKEEKKVFQPKSTLDSALQREIDEALGDMSVEDLLAAEEMASKAQAGEKPVAEGVRIGRVIAVHKDDVFVDLGGKSQGILPAQQFQDEPLPEEGDTIEVTIEGYDPKDGLLLLSRKGAVMAVAWETLEEGQIVEGRVTGFNKGGLELSLNGVPAFMPFSQIERFRVEELEPYVQRKLTCQVVEISEEGQKIIVSQRAVLEREAEEQREKAFGELQEGQVVPGVVRSIMPYGAFVDIGGVDGLLHVREMSHSRVEDPSDILSEGEQVQVMILKVDAEERRISLGLKQTQPDPWKGAAGKWAPKSIATGRVTRLADFGAFVELEPGVEGLIPMGEMVYGRRIRHAGEVLSEGDTIKVRILDVDTDRKRISLSLKQMGDDPWVGASVRWPAESIVSGIVTRITDFGAFVELAPGVEGLVHISELAEGHVRRAGDVVREGETIQAKVLEVDEERRRIGLSIKQVAGAAGQAGYDTAEPQQPRPDRKRPLKGGLD